MATRSRPTPNTTDTTADEWRAPLGATGEGSSIAALTVQSDELSNKRQNKIAAI